MFLPRIVKSYELIEDIQQNILIEYPPSHFKGSPEAVLARNNFLEALAKDDKRRGQDDHTSWRYTLIQNYSSVQEPETKWGYTPPVVKCDKSLGANVERMRNLQTKIVQIVLSGETSETVMNLFWSELEQVIKDVAAAMGKSDYVEKLKTVRTEVIDPTTGSEMVEKFLRKVSGGQRQNCSSQASMPMSCMLQMKQQLTRIESAVRKKRKIDVAF